VLRRLAAMRIIHLPPKLTGNKASRQHSSMKRDEKSLLRHLLIPVKQMPSLLTLELAKGNSAERLWNALVEEHHYLGHRVQVGRCLKYLIKGDGILLGAISFSSPAWKLSSRDAVLRLLGLTGRDVRDLVVNNSRFCIAPTVQVPHLASRILAQATKQISADWLEYYSIEPVIAETFVEPSRFAGTCYRAANWIEIGSTSGYAKAGSSHHNSQEPKRVFLYGLSRDYRRRLTSEVERRNT
jgi:hypothetical protein